MSSSGIVALASRENSLHNDTLGAPLAPPAAPPVDDLHMSWAEPTSNFGDFALFIDSMAIPYANSAILPTEQPVLQLPSTPLPGALGSHAARSQVHRRNGGVSDPVTTDTSAPRLFDDFTSTFPSFEPSSKSIQEPWRITQENWNHLLVEIQGFAPVLPPQFFLPSRHTITRYITTYFAGFHRHLPFLHIPTFSPTKCPVELVLAMATIGAQSAFDHENAIMFYRTSLAIVQERLRCRKIQRRESSFPTAEWVPKNSGVNPARSQPHTPEGSQPAWTAGATTRDEAFEPLPIAQTLLVLMAMATWGNSKAIFNEAVGLQNTLTNFIREEDLLEAPPPRVATWQAWIKAEGMNRTITIIFDFLVFHTIVYNTPPAILNSELQTRLPSREAEWEAASAAEWTAAATTRYASPDQQTRVEPTFQTTFALLFSNQPTDTTPEITYTSLGGYTLILALIQHIYLVRATHPTQTLQAADQHAIERALQTWQKSWPRDPESFFGPGGPRGPISFNATALLRMAYIRLAVDVGPARALIIHDPNGLAAAMFRYCCAHAVSHPRDRRLTRAVLYSAHALSIPVKIGVNIVAKNQAFAWSLQHALCALEGAVVLSSWLMGVQARWGEHVDREEEEERRLWAYIADMVAEADPAGEAGPLRTDLCTRVVRVWAKLLSGEAVWDVVRMIGRALDAYARMLEGRGSDSA
ncbi:uncharacterized protein BO97DRAFT_399281 [Aspergillus homomorphus CBS 101889]|uniref:Xylanolytic transcriptional activator regulatory domain-containing protein n=1 Tax=Aspergillus homomorphus (strain CBS 101889) TaxID=1450537 RepID=A0A395HJK3_ASPHC|nr:hypothetical protein BO97DRAFT_399281 [Aspergillus homomorphus CBS 101889]RAL07806.1 hypothetical protein BO97DRAFT_399281 [Aspergillus homomorphus CBS 101889]